MSKNILFIYVQSIKDMTGLHANVDEKLVLPEIKTAQDMYILPALGSAFYNRLQTGVDSNNLTANELILINLNSTDLTFIQTYLEHYINDADIKYREKAISNIFSENVSNQWDIDFIENEIMKDPLMAKKQLYAVLNAADYLHIEKLIQLICLKIATMIKCISLEKIKTILDPTTPYYKS